MQDLADNLKTVADHAWWMRDETWTKTWWETFFSPLLGEGLFLPPLLAYDVCSSADRGEHRRGPATICRQHSEAWGAFLLWSQKTILGCLTPRSLASTEARSRSARRLARLLAANLMDRIDVSGLRENGAFSPGACLAAESEHLSGHEHPALKELWKRIESDVLSGHSSELASSADSIPYAGRNSEDLDLFVPRLLADPFPSTAFEEPQITGWEPRADNPRVALSPTGEFAQRDTGGVPGELARLAPSELLLLQQATLEERRSHRDTTSRDAGNAPAQGGFRTLFLYRAARRELLQRFSQAPRPSLMEPSMLLQIDLYDQLELHRLSDPPLPPIISWYRAALVSLIHLFAHLARPFRWDIRFELNHFSARGRERRRLHQPDLDALGLSPESCFSHLASGLPGFFSSRSCFGMEPGDRSAGSLEVDLWLRVVLGDPAEFSRGIEGKEQVLTNLEVGARLERIRNGNYGLRCCESALEAHLIELEFSRDPAPPTLAAWQLTGQALDLVEEIRT